MFLIIQLLFLVRLLLLLLSPFTLAALHARAKSNCLTPIESVVKNVISVN